MALPSTQIKDLISDLDGFGDLTVPQQDELIDLVRTNPEARQEIFNSIPDLAQLPEEQMAGINGAIDAPELVDGRQGDYFNPGADRPLDAAVARIKSAGASSVAGLSQLGLDQWNAYMDFKKYWVGLSDVEAEANEVNNEIQRGFINRTREYAQQQMKERATLGQQMSPTENFVVDTAAGVMEELPGMLASIYTGTAVPAILSGVIRGASATYDKTRQAGYAPTESAVRASVTGAGMGAMSALSTKQALSLGTPFLKRLVKGAAIDAVGGVGVGGAEIMSDYLVDTLYKSDQKNLLPAEIQDFGDALSYVAYTTATNVVGGVFTNALPELNVRAKLWAQDLKAVDLPNGKTAILPKEGADLIEPVMRQAAKDDPNYDPAKTMAALHEEAKVNQNFSNKINAIKEQQKTTPLTDYQKAPTPLSASKLVENMEVGISADFWRNKSSEPLSETTGGKVVAWRKLRGKAKKAAKEQGNKSAFVVDVQIETADGPQIIKNVPRNQLTEAPQSPFTRGKYTPEAPHMVEFLRNLMTPEGLDFASMSGDEARRALGGFFRTAQELAKGSLGVISKYNKGDKKPYGAIVWDAAANNPDQGFRILTHEIGHALTDLSPEAAKKFGLENFTPFRKFVLGAEDITNLPPAEQTTIKRELNDMWDAWALYQDKTDTKFSPNQKTGDLQGGNVGELMANSLSLFLNDPDSTALGYNFQDTLLFKKFQDFITQNKDVGSAYNLMKARAESPEGSILRSIREGLATANEAEIALRQRADAAADPAIDRWITGLWNEFYPYLKAMNFDPGAVERIDSHYLTNGKHAEYLRQATEPAIKMFKQKGVDPNDFSAWILANRVLTDRKRIVKILKDPTKFDSMDDYQKFKAVAADELRRLLAHDEPDLPGKEVDAIITKELASIDADETFKKTINLRNPMGLDETSAQKAMVDIQNKYKDRGIDNIDQLMNDAQKSERVAFNEWILPILKDSKLYTPDMLAHMAENDNYAFFDVVMHKYYSSGRKKPSPGSVNGFYKQQGTTALVSDPYSSTLQKMVRMASAVKKSALMRDMLSDIADSGLAKSDDSVRRVTKDSDGDYPDVPAGYELVKTKQYNQDSGEMVEQAFIAKDSIVKTMDNTLRKNVVMDLLDAPNRYLKTWFTVYNPGFWLVNFIRDNMRSALNLPGFSAMWEVPIESAKQVVNPDKKLREQMVREDLLLGGIRWDDVDANQANFERTMAMVGERLNPLKTTWEEVDSIRSAADYMMERGKFGIDVLKDVASNIGERVENATKLSAYKYMQDNYGSKMTPEEIKWYTRNSAGTPLLTRKGSWSPLLSQFLLFYNPNVQGVIGDIQTIKKQGLKDALINGSLGKRALAFGMNQAFLAGILNGFVGEEMKDMVERIPVRHMMRYFNIPLGITQDGLTSYISLPLDPFSQMVNTLAFTTATKMRLEEYTPQDMAGDIGQLVSEQIPNWTPTITTGMDVGELITTGNIQDNYYGEDVIPRHIANSNDTGEKANYILSHFYRSGFAGPFGAVHRLPFKSSTPKFRGEAGNKILTSLSDAVGIPGLSNSLGRYLRFSDAGIKNWSDMRYRASRRAEQSKRNAANRAVVQKITQPDQPLTKQQMIDLVSAEGTSKFMLKKLKTLSAVTAKDPRIQAYIKLYLNENNQSVKRQILADVAKFINNSNRKEVE